MLIMSALDLGIKDNIATITLSGPTMPPAFFGELRSSFHSLCDNEEVRAVVVCSSAKSFSFGLDLPATLHEHAKLFSGGGATERRELREMIRDWQDCFLAVEGCPVPVIAAVHGACIGGGIDLISACDIRLASQDATFSVRETKVAIVADLGTLQRLPNIVGQGHARELALTGCDIDAHRAAQIGLVNHVHADRDELHQAAQAMAASIAANPPLTVQGVKKVMQFGSEHGVRAGLDYVATWNAAYLASEDLGEAMAAFTNKRPPSFVGR